ncbi:MAG: ribonuclease Z [Candidatus Aenigmarchaeota archaeon ex4484_52]|nr:MAG: ribonuclease Z [Candidatus Aenigmarchaeota archaeon ex4484_52]
MIKLIFLGTSSGIPTKKRNLPSIFVMYKKDRMLFDCGEGTQRQLMIKKLKFVKISKIFITHWHADHFSGLIGLIQSMELEGRKEPLYIFGPVHTKKFTEQFISVGYFARRFDILVKEMKNEDVVDFGNYIIQSFEVKHRIPAIGYIFQEKKRINIDTKKLAKYNINKGPLIGKLKRNGFIEKDNTLIKLEDVSIAKNGRKIVYTGDTKYFPELEKYAEKADIFICDATFDDEYSKKAYIYGHCCASIAAKIAKAVNVKKLYLTHISRRYSEENKTDKIIQNQARQIFKKSYLARDLLEVNVR